MGSEFAITGIGQVSIRIRDMDAAVRFYEETLGLKLLFRIPGMSFFDCGGVRIVLGIPEDAAFDHPSSVFYFNVDDIHSAYDTLAARGVEFMGKPHPVAEMDGIATWMAFFRDPDQNVHALMSEVSVSG